MKLLSILLLMFSLTSMAQDDYSESADNNGSRFNRMRKRHRKLQKKRWENLSDEQKAKIKGRAANKGYDLSTEEGRQEFKEYRKGKLKKKRENFKSMSREEKREFLKSHKGQFAKRKKRQLKRRRKRRSQRNSNE